MDHRKHDPCIYPEVITDICRTLAISEISNQSLQMLEIQNLPITYDDVLMLCKGLNKAKNLRFLSLENCLIGEGAVSDLCSTLKNCSQVIALNLSGCRIGDAGMRSIANLLQ
nr:centrosomal protein of 78 kda [Hymenolepis microstoma]